MRVKKEKIRESREVLGLTTSDLAERIGVTRQAVEFYERVGIGTFSILNKVAAALRVDPKSLIDSD